MLSTVLVAVGDAVPLLLLLAVVACAVAGWFLLRTPRRTTRLTGVIAVLSVVAVLVLTLYPESDVATRFCTVRFEWPSVNSIDGLANVVLFVPAAFFGSIVTRRPAAVALAGSGLSAAIELVQALTPALQRACDTVDWEMNTIGAAFGALLAWWVAGLAGATPRAGGRASKALGGSDPEPSRRLRLRWGATAVVGLALAVVAALPIITPPSPRVDACDEPAAGAATRLDGGYTVTAGASGLLCFRGSGGTTSMTADTGYGSLSSDGSWEVGAEAPGTMTARDSAGRTVRLRAVEGSDLLAWTSPQV